MLKVLLVAAGGAAGPILRCGTHNRLRTVKIKRLSEDLPVIVEIVDTLEKLEAFLAVVDPAITEGLATLEKAYVHFYRSGKPKT